jgi:hypothetical protein
MIPIARGEIFRSNGDDAAMIAVGVVAVGVIAFFGVFAVQRWRKGKSK